MFIIVAINERTGRKFDMGFAPMTHDQACCALKKITQYKWRRVQLEAVA